MDRKLRFDFLESRRLLAGLDVWVFQDLDASRSFDETTEHGVPRQVVFVDLNNNARQDRGEPIAISNVRGVASFDHLEPGDYTIRLLGENNSRLQTAPVTPALTGQIVKAVTLDSVLQSDDKFVYGTSGSRLVQMNWDGQVQQSIELNGQIIQSDWNGTSGFALVRNSEQQRLLQISGQDVLTLDSDASSLVTVSRLGDKIVGWDRELGLVQWDGSGTAAQQIPVSMGGQFQSMQVGDGNQVIFQESMESGTRVSIHNIVNGQANLFAERTFANAPTSLIVAASTHSLYLEFADGIHILNMASGLPTLEVLEGSKGPILQDLSAGLIYTGMANDPKLLQAWDNVTLERDVVVPITESLASLAISNSGRLLLGITEQGLYRQQLAMAAGIQVAASENERKSVMIGVQTSGSPQTIVGASLNSIKVFEDQSISIDVTGFLDQGNGETPYLVLLSAPSKGRFEWSVESGGVYIPFKDAEGTDSVVVAYYNGWSWSQAERMEILISGQNDPPTGIELPSKLELSENVEGGIVGPVRVADVDAAASYRWEVSDPRFEIRDGVLRLTEDAMVSVSDAEEILLTIRAIDSTTSESPFEVTTNVALKIKSNPKPAELHAAEEYTIAENVSGASLGYVYVSGGNPADEYSIGVNDSRFEVSNGLLKLRDGVSLTWEKSDAVEISVVASTSSGDQLTKNILIRVIPDTTPSDPHDVDGDGRVTPLDVLILINTLNENGAGPVPTEGEHGDRIDVDGDGNVSPIDVLILINIINNQIDEEGDIVSPPDRVQDELDGEGENEEARIDVAISGIANEIEPDVRGVRKPR